MIDFRIFKKILEYISFEELHPVEKIHESLCKRSFNLTKKGTGDELVSKSKGTQSATNMTDKIIRLLICLPDK